MGAMFGKTFNPDKDIPSLDGKVVLITGGESVTSDGKPNNSHSTGNTGLGKETVLQLAKHNPRQIFLAARTASKAEAAIDEITKAVPGAKISHLQLDLTSFDSIKHAAKEFTSTSDRLDLLINNAGMP